MVSAPAEPVAVAAPAQPMRAMAEAAGGGSGHGPGGNAGGGAGGGDGGGIDEDLQVTGAADDLFNGHAMLVVLNVQPCALLLKVLLNNTCPEFQSEHAIVCMHRRASTSSENLNVGCLTWPKSFQ